MWKNNLLVFYYNIYLVSCAPTEERNELSAASRSDQISQGSNIGEVSVFEQQTNVKFNCVFLM